MANESFVISDNATYVGFSALLKSIDDGILQRIDSIGNIDRSKKGKFHKPTNAVYMGMVVGQLHYQHNKSVRLTIEEWTKAGKTGHKFSLFLYHISAELWLSNPTIKTHNNFGKAIIYFQNITYQMKTGEIEFHLTAVRRGNISIWVKNMCMSISEAGIEDYQYTSLNHAAETLSTRCNVYGVVDQVIKHPSQTSRKSVHGMCVLTDPSCYDGLSKQKDFLCHIFSTTVDVYPLVHVGDVVRIHRAKTEPREDKSPDFRVFREKDVVVFPWKDSELPRSCSNRFFLTESDVTEVKRLKQWAVERYRKPTDTVEPHLITLNEITCDKPFNLPCRLVEFFDEGNGVALWIEDGTACPLYTCSDAKMQPYDSQETQDICNNCLRICVRSSKQLLENLQLEHNMSLYLRQVVTSVHYSYPTVGDIVQFEVKGGVELLPVNTRYHKSLMQRLEKAKQPPEQPPEQTLEQQQEQPLEQQLEQQLEQPQEHSEQPEATNTAAELNGSSMDISDIILDSVENPETQESKASNGQHSSGSKEKIVSSGEYSTERAMVELPSEVFRSMELGSSLVPSVTTLRAEMKREEMRLQLLINPCLNEEESSRNRILTQSDDLSFSQVVTSTQKPVEPRSRSPSQDEIPNAQSLFNNDSSHFQESDPTADSPNPKYKAVEEVLDVRTVISPTLNSRLAANLLPNPDKRSSLSAKLKRNVDFNLQPPVEDVKRISQSTFVVERMVQSPEKTNQTKEIIEETEMIEKTANETHKKGSNDLVRKRRESDSSSIEVVEVFPTNPETSQDDSDNESIFVYNPTSQVDFEKLFQAVELAAADQQDAHLQSLFEVESILPEQRFQIRAHLTELLPRSSDSQEPNGLENILIAFCFECKHIWQYGHFKNSVSRRVRRKKRTPPTGPQDQDCKDVINYLCSEEEHHRVMQTVVDSDDPNLDLLEYDEQCHIDNSYAFVCPMCKMKGIPDVLCQLQPSFFFWLHITQQDQSCLHVMACGVHAEFFMGTKADHVCRSEEVWRRAEQRKDKLLEYGSQNPLNFSIRKSSGHNEFYLENTFVVYSNKHLPPW